MIKVLVVGNTLLVNRNDKTVAMQEYDSPNELKLTLKDMKDSGAISQHKYNRLVEVVNRHATEPNTQKR